MNKIGGLEIGEQTILTNFYTSLTSNGSLNWDLSNDLCGQTGIVCDSSNPKRIIQLYFLFSFLVHLNIIQERQETIKNQNRNLSNKRLQGSIPTQFTSLSNLQTLYAFPIFYFSS